MWHHDGEINLGTEENMISNEFVVKLCLDHEVKYGHKVVKKELIVALRGEIYFVKFIINPEEDDVEPGVVLGRSFMRLTKGIANFGNGTIKIYPELNPFLDSSGVQENVDDDSNRLLDDLDFGDVLEIKGVEILPFVCKMGKNNRNKRKQLEKYQLIYSYMGPSFSIEKPLTQEEAAREALAINIWRRFSIMKEERPVIETMTYSDKYKKILDGICIDKIKLDGEMKKEEEEAIIKVKGETLIAKEDPRAFVILIRMECREEVHRVNRGITMLNHSKAELMGILKDVLCQTMGTQDDGAGSSRSKRSRQYEMLEEAMLSRVHHPFLLWEGCNQAAKSRYNTRLAQLLPRHIYSPCVVDWNMLNQMCCGEVIDEMLTIKLCVFGTDEDIFTSEAWTGAFNINKLIYSKLCHEFYSTYEFDEVRTDDELRTKKMIKFRLCGRAFSRTLMEFAKRLGLYNSEEIKEEGFDVYFLARHQNEYANVAWLIARWMKGKGVDTTTLRELIDSEGRLIPEVPEPRVPRVAIPRPPRAAMQDLYERMGSMKIRQGAIERKSYRLSYH
ncbi:hypothetical protein Tco_1107236 [Tanacetum coccineum]